MKRTILMIASLALLLGYGGMARADLITYTFSGTGTGDLSGTSFTNAAFTITVNADTTNINYFHGNPGIPTIESNPATINIAGLGTGTFLNSTGVFDNQSASLLGFGLYEHSDYLDISSSLFATYGLDTSLGPVFDPSPSEVNQFHNAQLSNGTLTFSSASDVTFTATIATPEPSGIALLGLSMVCMALGYVVRRRKLAMAAA